MLLSLVIIPCQFLLFFFFNDTATTEIYTLSLHDALPISSTEARARARAVALIEQPIFSRSSGDRARSSRSEEHTSELQSRPHLVCRLLLEKKKKDNIGLNCCLAFAAD